MVFYFELVRRSSRGRNGSPLINQYEILGSNGGKYFKISFYPPFLLRFLALDLKELAPGAAEEAAPLGPSGTIRIASSHLEQPGDRIGRYKLLENIGEGGCGVVYVAEQTEPVRRHLALKVIKLGMDTVHTLWDIKGASSISTAAKLVGRQSRTVTRSY